MRSLYHAFAISFQSILSQEFLFRSSLAWNQFWESNKIKTSAAFQIRNVFPLSVCRSVCFCGCLCGCGSIMIYMPRMQVRVVPSPLLPSHVPAASFFFFVGPIESRKFNRISTEIADIS